MVVPGDVVVVVVGGCVNLVFVVGAMVEVVDFGVGSKSKMVWNISCKRSVIMDFCKKGQFLHLYWSKNLIAITCFSIFSNFLKVKGECKF